MMSYRPIEFNHAFECDSNGQTMVICASLQVGHARRIRSVFDYRITDLEAQIKTKQTKERWDLIEILTFENHSFTQRTIALSQMITLKIG